MPYQITDWDEHFEKSDSRKCKKMKWVAVPTDMSDLRFRKLSRRKDGAEIFGIWVIILEIASQMPKRGVLSDKNGDLTFEDMELLSGYPANSFKKAISILSSDEIQWISGYHPEKVGNHPDYNTLQDTTLHNNTLYASKFDEFWEVYPKRNGKKVGKKQSFENFKKLKIEDLDTVIQNAKNYGVDNDYPKDPERFLKKDFWKDWDTPQTKQKNTPYQEKLNQAKQVYNESAKSFNS